ncbi:Hypothetical protein FKW44_000634 [Caligus rogercresseyi]|uniref:Uncharacterized protein n=1 Tax=Caligus rogercresseyi TaxID=217165 RepID=A0A7T8KHQ3_CALRO|nr:Hypothetical protein FKW44_000634 [Caligus rogercresseyi]
MPRMSLLRITRPAGDCRITPPGAAENEVFSPYLGESALDELNSLANALDEDPASKNF